MATYSMSEKDTIPIPEAFITGSLPLIDNLGELRVSLYAFWLFTRLAEEPRYFTLRELLADDRLMDLFGEPMETRHDRLVHSLELACQRETLLVGTISKETCYFVNTEQGKAARDGFLAGSWKPGEEGRKLARFSPPRPNIFVLYEQNIGMLTPIISETLQEAEKEYPLEWIEEAIRIAVTRNARNWRFVEAVLRTWKEKGRHETDRGSSKEDRKRDSEGKFADYVNH